MADGMNAKLWNAYVAKRGPRSGAFLQSFEWGNFQESIGRKLIRRGDLSTGAAQFIEMPLPLGMRYLYCPRGPVGSVDLSEVAAKTGATFVRIEPETVPADVTLRPSAHVQPTHTLILDLTKGPEAILAAAHEKTRYNVRLSERKGVEVEIGSQDFGDAWPLFEVTGTRGGFRLHDRDYYAMMLNEMHGEAKAFLAVARYDGKVIAANIMIDFAGTRTYLHGASSDEHRNVMGPYLLHMKLIEDACALGLTAYDWWGVAPENAPETHSWTGITRFKLGFGGERVDYPGTFDLVTDRMGYGIYTLARHLKRG
jgi:peptidoglycan pentaglycine glycine transferase (the first glycine)